MNSKTLNRSAIYGGPSTLSLTPAKGHELINLRSLGLIPGFSGSEQGTNTWGDVIAQTVDGIDMSTMWTQLQASVTMQNEGRQAIVSFLTFPVSSVIDSVPQGGTADFEEASEFGEPKGQRISLSSFSLAYDFHWYDLAQRMTWQFLAEASSQQIEALHSQALDADNRLIFNKIMKRIFSDQDSRTDINSQPYTVYTFYNNDGAVPPTYGTNTFDNAHSHYTVSGAGVVDAGDLEALQGQLKEHGYSTATGSRLVLMVHSHEGDVIRTFRNGVNGALYDFIPALGTPAFLVPNANAGLLGTNGLVGQQVANTLEGLKVIGSYGDFIIVEDDLMPSGYLFAFATGGNSNLNNPVGFREHAKPGLRGLRLLPGNTNGYPLTDSFYSRGFGTGIRQRGAGAVMQITATGSYTIPAVYA